MPATVTEVPRYNRGPGETDHIMRTIVLGTAFALLASAVMAQQSRSLKTRPPVSFPVRRCRIPRRRRLKSAAPAPDGYAPIPQWAGQTRAPVPATTAAYEVQTFASGLMGAFAFHFLPDGRILLSERPGRMRIVEKDGRVSAPISGLPPFGTGGRNLFEVLPDRDFAKNRVIYFSYTALPEGQPSNPPRRSPGILMVARARLSADEKSVEDVKDLLNAEGTGGRVIQARDGTLAGHVDDSGGRRHQLGGLAPAAADGQPHGQGVAHQHRRLHSAGQSVCRPRRCSPRNLRHRFSRRSGCCDSSRRAANCG